MTAVERTELQRFESNGVALVGCCSAAQTGVTFCFTERTGGVSPAPFDSLNLGDKVGDDLSNVIENRRRVFVALGAQDLFENVVVPNQVHSDVVGILPPADVPLPEQVLLGCDAVVCTQPNRAVMLVFADCVPVVLVAPGGFAVVHSGWRGTLDGISGKAAKVLADEAGCAVKALHAYVGPHIGAAAYEVSEELLERFEGRFGGCARASDRHLDLGACIVAGLDEVGVARENVCDCGLCTVTRTDRFFSYRAENGVTGRHAAVAFMRG